MTKLTDITPEEFKCVPASCPAVFKWGEDSLAIIGKRVTESDYPELAGRIGPGEAAIKVDAAMIEAALAIKKWDTISEI